MSLTHIDPIDPTPTPTPSMKNVVKPSPTIAGKLRKLFNNNKQTIEPAIGDSIPGGSGANVLTLYVGLRYGDPWAYKDPECTVEYETLEEAESALNSADIIKLSTPRGFAFPTTVVITAEAASVTVCEVTADSVTGMRVYLFNIHTT